MSCSRHLIVARSILTPNRGAAPFDRTDTRVKVPPRQTVDRQRRSLLRTSALAVAALFTGKSISELKDRRR